MDTSVIQLQIYESFLFVKSIPLISVEVEVLVLVVVFFIQLVPDFL